MSLETIAFDVAWWVPPALASICSAMAKVRLSAKGLENPSRNGLLAGLFMDRDDFTPEGWRYCLVGRSVGVVGLVFMFGWLALQAWKPNG
jgi:hypothetical protein